MAAGHQPELPPQAGAASFTTTHWSMVLEAGDSQAPGASEALERLCRAYWPPIHAYLRRAGHSPEDASDLTQGFFAHILERGALRVADQDRGRFRSFLLTALKNFVAHERERGQARKRGGGALLFSFDEFQGDSREAIEPASARSPEAAFDQRWALDQIARALRRLREDYAASGRAPLFDLLKAYVWGEKNDFTLSEIAGQLDLTEEAVKKAVQRLRERFRETLRREIAQTLATPDRIDEELRHLRMALSG